MDAFLRLTALIPAGLLTLASASAAARQSPADYEAIVRAMRGCSSIQDVAARVSCYDRTIAPGSGTDTASIGTREAPAQPAVPRGFAAESLRVPERSATPERAELSISAVQELLPKVFRVTLEDSGVWELTEPLPIASDPPRRGARVTVRRGSLGAYFLEYGGQAPVRVKRIR